MLRLPEVFSEFLNSRQQSIDALLFTDSLIHRRRDMASKTSLDVEDSATDYESQSFLDLGERKKYSRNVRPWLWNAALLLLASGWLIPALRILSWDKPAKTPLPLQVFERIPKTFFPDDRYIGPSNATHHHWDHLVAAHDALYIPDAEEYGLPKGIFPPFDHPKKVGAGPPAFYVVTVLHQLHCLVR